MMIGPEAYYKMNIEGKSAAEIKEEIASLETVRKAYDETVK